MATMELGNGRYYSFLAFRGRGELFQMMGVQSVMDTTLSPPMVTPFTADWKEKKRKHKTKTLKVQKRKQ